jgi:hypothetical protein
MHITRNGLVEVSKESKSELTNVLGLDICVNEVAFLVEILQTEENLFGNAFDDTGGNTFLAVLLDEGEKVFTEWLEGDTYVGDGRDRMSERVEKIDDMCPSRMRWGSAGDLSE